MGNELLLKEISSALNIMTDPDLGLTFNELGAVKNISINELNINIELELVQPIQWISEKIINDCNEVLNAIAPNYKTDISLNEKYMDYEKRDVLKNIKNIVAVASGKGGVGKSAIAANIAAALSLTGAKVGILDADIYGPSQPTMFGLKDSTFEVMEMPDGKTSAFPNDQYGIKVASMGFAMNRDDAAIVRGPLLAGYFSMLFEQIEWGPLDFLVFDLPPGTGDIQLTLTQRIPLTGAVIVTTPQEIAVADVRRSISMFRRVEVDILGIIENMSYFTPPELPDKKYYIFGKGGGQIAAVEYDIPFLGEVPLDIQMREGNDGGMPIVFDEAIPPSSVILREITNSIVKQIRKHNYKLLTNPSLNISL